LRQFPDRHAFKQIAKNGFELVKAKNCFGGLLEIVLLRKQQHRHT
jgi:hypothetical protein